MDLKKLSRIADATDARARQLEKSLKVWQERLEKDPNNKKIQQMVQTRQEQLESYLNGNESAGSMKEDGVPSLKQEQKQEQDVKKVVGEIPSIKNSSDLYKFAEQLGIEYKGKNGKPLGTDVIKSKIAEVIWNEQHPGEEMPPQISPMLIKDITGEGKEYVDKTFKKEEWVLQNKINGQRFIMVLNPDGSTHMTSRDRSVKHFRYSELDDHVLGLLNLTSPFEHRCIVDGEIICDIAEVDLPSGVHTTSTLQSTVALMHMNSKDSLEFQRKNGFSLRYKVFDILEFDGKNVEKEPYDTRKELVATWGVKMKEANPDCAIDILPTIEDYESAWDTFQEYVSQGGEGLILKKRDAPYEQGKRSKNQWKLKAFIGIDAYVTGYVPASEDKGLSNYIGGFIFSTHYKGEEVEIGAVSNIDMATRKSATVYENGKPVLNPEWLGKCAEIKAQNFKKGSFRLGSARIEEWRDDKNPEDCELQDSQIVYDS